MACANATGQCLQCGHSRPHFCTRPSDVCIQGNAKKHYRVNVECSPLPSEIDTAKLADAVDQAEDDVSDARDRCEAAEDELDDANGRLAIAKEKLRQAELLDSARDFVAKDDAAIAQLPVI
jgi:predicted  nucleic acid-binding Zn-ribbon protein